MKIFLDPGHGGADLGAVGPYNRLEKDDNLDMAISLRLELIRRGHSVMMTRTGDPYPSLAERAALANAWGADMLLSLHRNAATPDKSGGETHYGPMADYRCTKLAEELCNRMNAACGFKNCGAKRVKAHALGAAKMAVVTVLAGHITSRVDNSKFDAQFYPIICALADAAETYSAALPKSGGDNYTAVPGAVYYVPAQAPAGGALMLEDYVSGGEYARVSDEEGNPFLIKWSDIKKIVG